MKEYTLLALASVFVTVFLDRRCGVNILKRREFYGYLFVILLFELAVNGYLTGRGIVIYASRSFLGVRLGSIPLEDLLFGFSMVTLTVVFWENFKKRTA